MTRVTASLLIAFALAVGGCESVEPEFAKGNTCQQTYELGNSGCGEVHGRILDASGTPIRAAYLSVMQAAPGGSSFGGAGQSDSLGSYRVRVIYFSVPDGTLAWVRFSVLYCPELFIKDSVLVALPKANVGQSVPALEMPDATLSLPTSAQRQAVCG